MPAPSPDTCRRPIALIVAAAADLLARDPDARMTDIAKTAGVGRVMLYGHFPSREHLIRTVLTEVIAHATAVIETVEPEEGSPAEAFARLVRTCWPLLNQAGGLQQAAQRALSAEEVRRHHDQPMAYVEQVIVRGQATGDFRADLSRRWLVTITYALLHAAGEVVHAGRLSPDDAGEILEKTLLAVLHPGGEVRAAR